jgi:hypothetical protein
MIRYGGILAKPTFNPSLEKGGQALFRDGREILKLG